MKRRPPVPHVPDRPLDQLTSIKVKLASLIVGAVGVTVFVFWFCIRILHFWPSAAGIVAAVVALVFVRRLARGMTSPLREMAEATQAMARGDYDQRVTATSNDEVGRLAVAFMKILVASIVMGLAARLSIGWISAYLPGSTLVVKAIRVGAAITIGLAVLVAAARLLRIAEFDEAFARVLRRLRPGA